jgi:hypothetical protein
VVSEEQQRAVRGLPGPLPAGERLLWQGSPDLAALARRTFHGRSIALYFAVLLAWVAASRLRDGATAGEAALGVLWFTPLAVAGLGLVVLLAWLTARTTVYTVTDRRVVLSYGIAFPMSLNLPFARVAAASARTFADGTADIPLAMAGDDRVAYLMLWPHARPWRVSRPEPALRAVPDGARVAGVLARALAAAAEQPVQAAVADGAAAGTRGAVATAAAA